MSPIHGILYATPNNGRNEGVRGRVIRGGTDARRGYIRRRGKRGDELPRTSKTPRLLRIRCLRLVVCDLELRRHLWRRVSGLTAPWIINPGALDQRRDRQRRHLLGPVRRRDAQETSVCKFTRRKPLLPVFTRQRRDCVSERGPPQAMPGSDCRFHCNSCNVIRDLEFIFYNINHFALHHRCLRLLAPFSFESSQS